MFYICFMYPTFHWCSTKWHTKDTQLTQEWEWTKQERGRRGKEWWIKVNLFLIKAGDWVLCNGLSRSSFCPLDFIRSSTSLWWSGSPDWFWRVAEEVERGPGCAKSGAGTGADLPCAGGLGACSCPQSPTPAIGEASMQLGAELGLSTLFF